MKTSDLTQVRRNQLTKWFKNRIVPEKDKSYISQLKSGKTTSFGEKAARRLEKEYGMPLGYLDNDKQEINLADNSDKFVIEFLDIKASAGVGYLNNEVMEVIKYIEYNSEQAATLFNGINKENIKVISINGDSMQPTFENGDSLFVDVSIRSFNSDGIYVFTFGKGLFVKRLQLVKDSLVVLSDNKIYKEWSITEGELDQLYIHGKVMLSQSMQLRKH